MLSLCFTLHSDEKDVALHMRRIVRLLERAVHIPELECCRDKLEGLLEEANCQVIVMTIMFTELSPVLKDGVFTGHSGVLP